MLDTGVTGCLVAIVGPSGAGKDSLIDYARNILAGDSGFLFVRRSITRPVDLGAEDHNPLSLGEFERQRAAGAFAVTWDAHGISYGIPSEALDHVEQGGVSIINGSRKALRKIAKVFPKVLVIVIEADLEIRSKRLARRGRESHKEIQERLQRTIEAETAVSVSARIDNNGLLDVAGERLVREFLNVASRARKAPPAA